MPFGIRAVLFVAALFRGDDNVAGGRYGMDYPMLIPGNSHGTALTFGYILGDILAGKEVL